MRKFIITLSLLLLAGCVQSNTFCTTSSESRFLSHPKPSAITLGKTTPQDVRAAYGDPVSLMAWHETNSTIERPVVQILFPDVPAHGSYKRMLYVYQSWKDEPHNTTVLTKRLRFTFYNDRLASYTYSSDFADDNSTFNDKNIRKIVKHKSTRADVISYLGEPAGRAIFPLQPIQGGEKMTYLYLHADLKNKVMQRRYMEVLIDAKGVVADYRYVNQKLPLEAKAKCC